MDVVDSHFSLHMKPRFLFFLRNPDKVKTWLLSWLQGPHYRTLLEM